MKNTITEAIIEFLIAMAVGLYGAGVSVVAPEKRPTGKALAKALKQALFIGGFAVLISYALAKSQGMTTWNLWIGCATAGFMGLAFVNQIIQRRTPADAAKPDINGDA